MLKKSGSLKRSGEHSAWSTGPLWVSANMNAIGFVRPRSDEFVLHIPNIPAADVLIEYYQNFTVIVCDYYFHEMSLSEVRTFYELRLALCLTLKLPFFAYNIVCSACL